MFLHILEVVDMVANVKKPFVRSPYNYDRNKVSRQTSIDFAEDIPENQSKTVQSSKEECDINVIVKRFGITGQLPQGVVPPSYAIFEDVFDYQTAMNSLVEAQNAFMQMPASVRSRFGNDPHEFVAFCSDPKNLDEMRKMGLAVPVKDDKISPKADVPPKGDDDGVKSSRSGKAPARKAGASGSGDSGGADES